MQPIIFRNRISVQDDPHLLVLMKKNLGQYPSAFKISDEKMIEMLNQATRVIVLTTFQRKVIGFLSWSEKNHVLFLEICVLDEKFQGRGIATHYIKRLEKFAVDRGFDRLQFYVDKKNSNAFRLYNRLGFKPIYTHPFMKTCLMEKTLL